MNFTILEFNSKEPIYLQIVDYIKKSIASGDLKAGDKLPSVRELSAAVGVNPNTLQRAYTELERLGITYTRRGMGSFVSTDVGYVDTLKEEMVNDIIKKCLSDLKEAGISKTEAIKLMEAMDCD